MLSLYTSFHNGFKSSSSKAVIRAPPEIIIEIHLQSSLKHPPMHFYISQGGTTVGPFDEAEVIAMWEKGDVHGNDLVWASDRVGLGAA